MNAPLLSIRADVEPAQITKVDIAVNVTKVYIKETTENALVSNSILPFGEYHNVIGKPHA